MEAGELLVRYVAEHNRGVRDGDFSDLVALLAPDAVMRFSGLAAGPFEGAGAIAAAFATRPPTDELVLLGPTRNHGRAAAAKYGWAGAPGVQAGAIRIGAQRGRIALIEVTVSGGHPPGRRPFRLPGPPVLRRSSRAALVSSRAGELRA